MRLAQVTLPSKYRCARTAAIILIGLPRPQCLAEREVQKQIVLACCLQALKHVPDVKMSATLNVASLYVLALR